MAVAALVLGIIGLFFAWIPFLGYVMPVLAIIFGVIERNNEEKKGMAIAGLILGIISLVIFKLGFWVLVMIGAIADSSGL
ncbi:DUF4190 domain-containing protein [Bacillus sp. JJ1566]|uniref:DUF4190 domain-containing protein n=1 Tax=Bacillus sp. JJ1566 TaxID=3122961 RepID=UPI003000AFA5